MARKSKRETAGEAPALATVEGAEFSAPQISRYRQSKTPTRINLRAVSEVLADYGMDPAAEMVRILTAEIPVTDTSGEPVLDENGEPLMTPALDADTRLRFMNELLQYTQPKLKSVDVKVDHTADLTDEQLERRIALLLARAEK